MYSSILYLEAYFEYSVYLYFLLAVIDTPRSYSLLDPVPKAKIK